MSVIGFDIGNESCTIATIKDGTIDIILNDDAKRQTPTVVCFGDKQRFIGSMGSAFASKFPGTTFTDLKHLLTLARDPIKLQYLSKEFEFTPTEMLAMIFSHLKQIAERNLESPVTKCVIGIPSHFQERQRRAYLTAAKIAGLQPLQLLHDCTAAAFSYGFYKRDISYYESNIVAFVDIGHCDTQVSIASFLPTGVAILSHTSDSSLGGRDFDKVIFSYFSEIFKEKYKIDVDANPKAVTRLKLESVKVKMVLSANTEASLNIEFFANGIDVEGEIKRQEFDVRCSNLLERIKATCQQAIKNACIPLNWVQSVELIGSGSRVPSISEIVASVFKKESKRTLNSSECIATGCALHCAILTRNSKFREYEIKESFPFSVHWEVYQRSGSSQFTDCSEVEARQTKEIVLGTISAEDVYRINELPQATSGEVFQKNGQFPATNSLNFQRKLPFELQILDHQRSVINIITISDCERENREQQMVKVQLELDINGIVKVHSAKREEANISRGIARYLHVLQFIKWPFSASVKPNNMLITERDNAEMSEADVAAAKRKQSYLSEVDERVGRVNDSKNALEAYVYDFRNKLNKKYAGIVGEDRKNEILKILEKTEEWVCKDDDERDERVYSSKLRDLKTLGDPISKRFKEEEKTSKRIK